MTDRRDMSLWDVAVETADAMGPRDEAAHVLRCIVVFPTMADGNRAAKGQSGERAGDILITSWGGTALLGYRTHNIVADRRDFMDALLATPESGRELMLRQRYIREMLLLKLVPGGRIILA